MSSVFSAVVIAGFGLVVYFFGSNWLLDRIFTPQVKDDGTALVWHERWRGAIRPWLFVAPALVLIGIFLVFPMIQTIIYSFFNANGTTFVGLRNYNWALNDPGFNQAILNNLLWLLLVPFVSTALGLVIAVLADNVSWGTIAKSLIFMPMAISFVGASVIWKFVYDYRGPNAEQIGVLNALVVALGGQPQPWIATPIWNNLFLMIILIWIQTGFAMVILSAALRGVPQETLEAAQVDGATEVQIFYRITIPQITGTILVVLTTITIVVLKVFDVVLAMTNGQWGTEVLANLMYNWMFRSGGDFGRGSVIAIVIMLAVLPIMFWNIRRYRREENAR